jgi:hypothetical protein
MDFEKSQNFADLCQANIRFLNGELDTSPYHLGPINSETYPILDDIIELNKRGLLTTNSQPGCQIIDYLGKDYQQNAYITFICRVDMAYYILSHLEGYLGYTDRDDPIHAQLGHHPTCDNHDLEFSIIHTSIWEVPISDLYHHHLWKELKTEYTGVCIFDPILTRNELFSDLKNLVLTKDAIP